VRLRPWDKRETDRHLARTVTNGRTGIAYQAARLLIRAYRLYQRAKTRLGQRQHAPGRPGVTEPGIVLISHHILTQEDRAAVSGGAGNIAFLCHDLIPALRPDLIGANTGEGRFGPYLEHLVASGAPAFCASDEASATLSDHMRAACIVSPVVHRFRTYAIEVRDEARPYVDAMISLPAFQEWTRAGLAETLVIERFETV
jgi:hypothetical protein